jgi:Arm DNA-binding domain
MLIDRDVDRAKPKPRTYRLSDGRGLYVLVTPSGGKLWRWKYRFDGKEKLMTFGGYPDVSLAMARERHAAARRLLASDVDPMAVRKAEKSESKPAERTFQTLTAAWMEHWRIDKSAQHVEATRRCLLADVLPVLGSRPIDDIEAPELVAMLETIETRGARDLAERALETCGQIFRYGIVHGYCKRNPAAQLRTSELLQPAVRSDMARVSSAELPALLRAGAEMMQRWADFLERTQGDQ